MPATLHEHALFAGSPLFAGVHNLTADVEAHTHDFVEIAVIGPGRGRQLTSQGAQPLRHGEVVVLRPGAWHAFSGCDDLTVANCCISAQALRTELAALHRIPMFHRLLWTDPVTAGSHGVHVTTVGPDAAAEAVAAIADLERDLNRGWRTPGRMLGRLVTILGILADGRDPTPFPDAPAIHPAVAACVTRLEATPAEPWRLDDLARAVNLDPAYLGRLFRRSVGLSPLGFLARVRAEHAATLLTNSTLPVARVGATVGWDDPTYFARRFRTLSGLTPTEYRRQSRPWRAIAGDEHEEQYFSCDVSHKRPSR